MKKRLQAKRQGQLRREVLKGEHRAERQRIGREQRALRRGDIPSRFIRRPRIYAPTVFTIDTRENREELLRFLRALREITVSRSLRVTVDFSRTEKMVSCGTLLFLAEARRIFSLSKETQTREPRPIGVRHVRDRKVSEVLQQIGFYDLVGRRGQGEPTAEDVIHWRATFGRGAEGEKADSLVQTLSDRLPQGLRSPMYAGLVEAMTNCAQHAYIRARRDGLGKRGKGEWWMFAKEQDGELSVVFCDLGIGIPESLPLTHAEGQVRELLARAGRASGTVYTDAHLVRAAVEIGRSRTRESHRGRGLRDVVEVIDSAGKGGLRIFSNRGAYSYRVRDGVASHLYGNYRHSIMGTLIQWTVPVIGKEPET